MKAILFDLDGTLIDSIPDLANSINYMLKKLNKKTFNVDKIREWVGNGATLLVKRALSGNFEVKYIDEEEFKKAYEIFMKHYENNLCNKTRVYENVVEVLEKIPCKKAIITNKPSKFVKPILDKLNLLEYFDLIIGADDVKEKKPSPYPLLYACERFKIKKNEVLMVGDSINDIEAAKRAGIVSVLVTYGYQKEKINADFVIDDIKELLRILDV